MAKRSLHRECRIPGARIRRAIEAGQTAAQLADETGFTAWRVCRHAEALGYRFPEAESYSMRPQRIVPPDADIIAAFDKGLTVREMAREWNVSHVAVFKHRNRLVDLGRLKLRPMSVGELCNAFKCTPEKLHRFRPEQLALPLEMAS